MAILPVALACPAPLTHAEASQAHAAIVWELATLLSYVRAILCRLLDELKQMEIMQRLRRSNALHAVFQEERSNETTRHLFRGTIKEAAGWF